MKALLIALVALVGIAFVALISSGAQAGGSSLVCDQSTNDGIVQGKFVAVGLTMCDAPQYPPTVDILNLAVFWQYCNWSSGLCSWADGGVYDLYGCNNCTWTHSRTNDDVPIGYYLGVNCRRAQTIHLIWPQLTQSQTRYYIVTASDGECR